MRTSVGCLLVLSLFGAGCGSVSDHGLPDLGNGGGLTVGCSADAPSGCSYALAQTYGIGAQTLTQSISYLDRIGEMRTFAIEIRRPINPAKPAPIVIWSHGGADGISDPSGVGNEIGDVFLAAGFVGVFIAHAPRDLDSYAALCASLAYPAVECETPACSNTTPCSVGACVGGFCRRSKLVHWDRPHDLAAVIDWIEQQTAPGMPYAGLVDPTKIVYAGHSAGAGATEGVAGAPRDIGGVREVMHDPRPMAFISGSPEGPGDDGFTEESFNGAECLAARGPGASCLTRPQLFLTGVGDETNETESAPRRLAYDLPPTTDKYRLWITEPPARHTTFEHKTEGCVSWMQQSGGDIARCETYLAWQRSAIWAFLDAYVRNVPTAQAYLRSNDLVVLSGGGVEWSSK